MKHGFNYLHWKHLKVELLNLRRTPLSASSHDVVGKSVDLVADDMVDTRLLKERSLGPHKDEVNFKKAEETHSVNTPPLQSVCLP